MAATEHQTIQYTQERLAEWGSWLRNLRGVNIGLPSTSAFINERIDNDHGDDILMDGISNSRAEEIETIMCRLASRAPSLHRPLMESYYMRSTQADAARACHCSVAMYRARLRTGEMWVAACLDSIKLLYESA